MIYVLQDNPRLRRDTRLFTCIQFRSLFALRSFLTRLMNGWLEFILSYNRGPAGSPKHTNVRPAHLSESSFLSPIANESYRVLHVGLEAALTGSKSS